MNKIVIGIIFSIIAGIIDVIPNNRKINMKKEWCKVLKDKINGFLNKKKRVFRPGKRNCHWWCGDLK